MIEGLIPPEVGLFFNSTTQPFNYLTTSLMRSGHRLQWIYSLVTGIKIYTEKSAK